MLEGYNFLRMDGTTETSERERIVKVPAHASLFYFVSYHGFIICWLHIMHLCIQDFQDGLGAQIFLLTTKVGGLGLTLTKAARVIVVDPAWNPRYPNIDTPSSSPILLLLQNACHCKFSIP